MSRLEAAIATTRFGMGARAGEIDAAASDPRGWLKAQIKDGATQSNEQLPSARDLLISRYGAETDGPLGKGMVQQKQAEAREALSREIRSRLRHAISTPNSFAERWARFWANHFTVAVRNASLVPLVGPYEREAVRANAFGNFRTLLRKATLHPGMLVYLDADKSVGPSTFLAQHKDAGLNENLAREVLELHTLGVGSGYTQGDIIEFAKALTGYTVSGMPTSRLAMTQAGYRRKSSANDTLGRTVFVDGLHEPGPRTVLGKRYAEAGREQALSMLDDFAAHPATAKHIAVKLARHFVSDKPPPTAIDKLSATFTRSEGDLAVLARAVIDLNEAWGETQLKFKTPEELIVSFARCANERTQGAKLPQAYASMAQQPFSAPSPAGWSDEAEFWAGPDAIKKRLDWSNTVARALARGASANDVLVQALGDLASQHTRDAVARAESAEQGFTLLLMSPEFQRR